MDNLSSTPNSAVPSERPGGPGPEQLSPAGNERPQAPVTPEQAGNPAGGGQPPATSQPAAKLSPADVAAALAATPAVGSPVTPAATNPGLAGDVDVIEPEWVNKAEDVIRAHQGDPYGEEEAIEELQIDYLQKRYGINVAGADADDTKPKGT